MTGEDLKNYSNGLTNFFSQFQDSKLTIGDPKEMSDNFVFLDYSAIIGISGAIKGGAYITASTAMVDDLLVAMGMSAGDDPMRRDMIGEAANNITGNAGEAYEENFKISVPIIVTGDDHNIQLPVKIPAYSFPCEWKGHKLFYIVGTE